MIIQHQHCLNKLNQTKNKEPDMKYKILKLVLTAFVVVFIFSGLSCDDRKASDAVEEEGLTLAFIKSQPVANGASVGEAIVGYAGVLLIVELRDADGQAVKNGLVSFSAKVNGSSYGEFDVNSTSTNSDGIVVVTYSASSGAGAVDNPTTPLYENVEVTAYYSESLEASTRFDVYGSKDDVWPYSFSMTDPSPEEIILATDTPSNITCRLLNKSGTPVRNVIVQIDAGDKGYIKIDDNVVDSDTTDNNGEISFSFHDNGEEENIGIASVRAIFNHPSINATVSDTSTISIVSEVGLVQECTYVEIPSSVPDHIVVRDGGGIESTSIKAKLYDDNDNLIAEPRLIRFVLNPVIEDTYLEEPGVTDTSVYTVNGIATVSVNSGTAPGPVRIEVGVDCDQDGEYEINANAVPVIIASGAPYHIEPEYDPNSTEPIGGGFYKTQCAAIVYDRWYNPVEDSTYVYWSIDPMLPDTLIDAFVEGVSFTNNEGILSGIATSGVARSNIVYSTDAIGAIGRVRALTYGAGGDSVVTFINEDEGDATMFFLPGQVSLMASATYHDFTLNGNPALVQITAIVIDYYGNAVVDAPIAFNGTGINNFYEVQYENVDWADEGVNGAGAGDGCFTWRDYGLDDDPSTLDWGTYNDNHDSFDTTGNGEWDSQEISEFFNDYGLDGVPNTSDEGEGNGEWDGYSMIGCEPIVKTDEDGFARIIVEFDQALCTLANEDDETGICTWDDFTASISATLLIPEITTSEPLDILLVRSPDTCD